MPADITTAVNFKADSDYPLDKVVYLKTGSAVLASAASTTIAHGLGFIPLVGGSWSTDSTFGINYEYGSGSFPSGNLGYTFSVSLVIYADATNVYITNQGLSSSTVYYRIFGLEPDDFNTSLNNLSSSGDNFVLNTDYNYRKLFSGTHFTFTSGTTYTITHNLGYIPQVLAWGRYSIGGYAASQTMNPVIWSDDQGAFGATISLEVTTTTIIFRVGSIGSASTIYYRIYLDS